MKTVSLFQDKRGIGSSQLEAALKSIYSPLGHCSQMHLYLS